MDELTELALTARDGDAVAAGAFVRSTYRDVWRFCAYLDHGGAADDLTQEVYVRALRALPGFRGDASAKTWLLAIARRVAADTGRSASRRRRLDRRIPAGRDVEGDSAAAVEIHDLLARLDPDRREAFVLTQVVGLTYAETAEVCGCAVGTVRSRVARARAELMREMERAQSA